MILSHADCTDSLNMLYSEFSLTCDSLNRVINNSPYRIEKKKLEAKIRETKVINIPKNHEFILWQAARGIDTTMSSLAYGYSNELKKIPEDPNEQTYKDYKNHIAKLSTNIDNANKILSILMSQSKLVDLYIEETKDLPIYKAYIVYQALTKGGTNNLSEE